MRKLIVCMLTMVAVFAVASVAMAAPGDEVFLDAAGLSIVSAGAVIGMGLAAAGCGAGMGAAVSGACSATARNPELEKRLFTLLLLGMALIESLAIYTLVIAFILLFMNPYIA